MIRRIDKVAGVFWCGNLADELADCMGVPDVSNYTSYGFSIPGRMRDFDGGAMHKMLVRKLPCTSLLRILDEYLR